MTLFSKYLTNVGYKEQRQLEEIDILHLRIKSIELSMLHLQ